MRNFSLSFACFVSTLASAASYHVPVTDPALEPFATFEVSLFRLTPSATDTNLAQLEYTLPEDLTLENPRGVIRLDGQKNEQGGWSFGGAYGTATCVESDGSAQWACSVAQGVSFSSDGAREFLSKKYPSAPAREIEARARVVETFARDPIGVLLSD